MKQNITIEQLAELSPKLQIKLKLWAIKHHYFWDLSIGQMIEFLDDKTKNIYLLEDLSGSSEGYKYLCDDLWEKVKEVLKNENDK